jgi:hypothetical protein
MAALDRCCGGAVGEMIGIGIKTLAVIVPFGRDHATHALRDFDHADELHGFADADVRPCAAIYHKRHHRLDAAAIVRFLRQHDLAGDDRKCGSGLTAVALAARLMAEASTCARRC